MNGRTDERTNEQTSDMRPYSSELIGFHDWIQEEIGI